MLSITGVILSSMQNISCYFQLQDSKCYHNSRDFGSKNNRCYDNRRFSASCVIVRPPSARGTTEPAIYFLSVYCCCIIIINIIHYSHLILCINVLCVLFYLFVLFILSFVLFINLFYSFLLFTVILSFVCADVDNKLI